MAISQDSTKTNLLGRLLSPLKKKNNSSNQQLLEAMDAGQPIGDKQWQESGKDHSWLHFTRHSPFNSSDMRIIVRGEGHFLYDSKGNRLIDALSGLYTCNAGHARRELAFAAQKQMMELDFMPLWSFNHPRAIELTEKLLSIGPEGMTRIFFTTGGTEGVETAWKLAKQYFKLTGKPMKHKVISKMTSYHGTSHGALSITGLPNFKQVFEPLVPSAFRVPNNNYFRAPEQFQSEDEFGIWCANRLEEAILFEGPESVAAFFIEPIQNAGGCFTAPPSYYGRVREICSKYDVVLVADETITGYGRSGEWFGSIRYGIQPDMMITAKAITSGAQPLGAVFLKEKFFEPFSQGTTTFSHGYTFAGHPVACAVALANLEIFEREKLVDNVRTNSPVFRKTLEKLYDLPIVGDVRGDGYFFAIELVKDQRSKQRLTRDESEKLLRGFLNNALLDAGLYCRADDRGDSVVQLAPPLTAGPNEFDEIEAILRKVLTEAWRKLNG
jgi:adenosylmethionine-8-amino-7-oxononanoate aminotransferase